MGASGKAGRGGSDRARKRRRARRLTLAVGLVLIASGIAATLAQDAERRTGTNGIPATVFLGRMEPGNTLCQTDERIPGATAALRFTAVSTSQAAPQLTVTLAHGGVVRAKSSDARREGKDAIVVPFARPLDARALAEVCVRVHASEQRAYGFMGVETYLGEGASKDGQPLPGAMHIEYVSADGGSWWAFAPTLVRRLGRGHAWSGAPVVALAVLLMLTPIALSAWQLSRDES
jgi:hypothetical protein